LLQPQKLAVIATHEALMHTLLHPADGAPIASLCVRIGDAVEAEVNVQRLLQRQLLETKEREAEHDDVDTTAAADSAASLEKLMDAWMYGPSHLQRYLDESHQRDGKKRTRVHSVKYANRRAQKLLLDSEPWSDAIKLKVGVALVEVLLNVATIQVDGKEEKAFSYEKRWHRFRRQSGHVLLHDRLVKMIVEDTFDSLEASTMRYKPMILPPRDWVAPDDGGYSWLKIDFMRTHGSNTQRVS
jgi:DNA-directed RNA polymerase